MIEIVISLITVIVSFLVNAGVVKLLSLCFGFAFSWKLALGIWLVSLALKNIFRKEKN